MNKKFNFSTFIKALVIFLPCTLYFSYYPLVYLGSNSLMNFELSLPLIFLVIYALASVVYIIKNRHNLPPISKSLVALFTTFPLYATISILWSRSQIHGILAAGILWLISFAVLTFFWLYRPFFQENNFKRRAYHTFMIVGIGVAAFAWLQSILDVIGVSSDTTLMCTGCVYKSFGFPHPNGFMAEPQYFGGVLLAPTLISFYNFLRRPSWRHAILSFVFAATLFLSFSRGAIYAMGLAIIFITAASLIRTKTARPLLLLPIVGIAFTFTLNAQGIMAQVSPTDDTYLTGISKSLNQLSLGIIDLNFESSAESSSPELEPVAEAPIAEETVTQTEPIETSVQDGYVEESTNGRLVLGSAAVELWRSRLNYTIAGTGIGSAGATIYEEFVEPGTLNREDMKTKIVEAGVDIPSLNVQSEYAELLVEFGLIGVVIITTIAIYMARKIWAHPDRLLLISLSLAYLVAMAFCSGLTNSLYLYLMIPYLVVLFSNPRAKTHGRH